MPDRFKNKLWNGFPVFGPFTETLQSAEMWKKAGVQYISYSVDIGIFTTSCREIVNSFMGEE